MKTFTREDYDRAVKQANAEFIEEVSVKNEDGGGAMVTVMMALQNLAFAGHISEILFGEDVSEEDTENTTEA